MKKSSQIKKKSKSSDSNSAHKENALFISTFLDETRFNQTKNSVYVIKAFIEAHEKKTCPPQWVMDYLLKVFMDFDDSNGMKELNKLFGFKKGKGQCPGYVEFYTEKRYKALCLDVFRLINYLGMSIDLACSLVADRLENTSDYDMGFKLKKISEGTIKDKYYKRWGKKFNTTEWYKTHTSNSREIDIINFLKKFSKELLENNKNCCPAIRAYLPSL